MANPLSGHRDELIRALETAGFQVVEMHVGERRDLRVTIDLESGVDLQGCVRATHLIRDHLAEAGLDPGDFRVEVESPGADRLLSRAADFERFRGRRVRVTLREKKEGRKRFTGALEEGNDETVTVIVDGLGRVDFSRSDIDEIRLHEIRP